MHYDKLVLTDLSMPEFTLHEPVSGPQIRPASSLATAVHAADGCEYDCCAPSPEIASCSLDREALLAQRDRYAAIGGTVLGVERLPLRGDRHSTGPCLYLHSASAGVA